MSEVFVSSRSIAFGDIDAARILYYPRLFHYCHQAMEDFSAAVFGLPYVDFLERENLGLPAVHLEADYWRPIPYGVDLELSVSLQRLGNKSLVIRYVGRTHPDEPPRCEARVTNVLVKMSDFSSCEIPDWLRSRLEPYVEDS